MQCRSQTFCNTSNLKNHIIITRHLIVFSWINPNFYTHSQAVSFVLYSRVLQYFKLSGAMLHCCKQNIDDTLYRYLRIDTFKPIQIMDRFSVLILLAVSPNPNTTMKRNVFLFKKFEYFGIDVFNF